MDRRAYCPKCSSGATRPVSFTSDLAECLVCNFIWTHGLEKETRVLIQNQRKYGGPPIGTRIKEPLLWNH